MNRAIVPPLSGRQAEIAELLVSGKSSREIALALVLSKRTVETHVAAIYNKYGVSSRVELMRAVLASDAGGDARANARASKTNLPEHRSGLVGRETDIGEIVETLHRTRLVTITGAGGIGKTRTALAVGQAVRTTIAGVWLVELAPVTRASLVADAVGRALGIRQAADSTLMQTLVARLERESVMLVLDNCEHLIDEAAAVASALLQGCPSLRILATSREPLRIGGEQTYRLTSLRFPTSDETVGLSAVRSAQYAAIELFAQRAKAVDNGFVLSDEDAPSVADLCRALDGIPLAIELAAARVNILPVRSLATKLDRQLRLLSGGDRTALPRHRTMHALIDWSYDLLSPVERRLFERLSVFSGGCALAEITVVLDDEAIDEVATLQLLSSLVDKSLVVADVSASEPRYDLLQSFRWYAAEKLAARGESADVSRLHAIAYVDRAETRDRRFDVIAHNEWFAGASSEFDNFRSALAWTLEARHDILLGQRLAAAMRSAYAGAYAERHWLKIACDLVDESTPLRVRADLEYAAAWMRYSNGEWEAALGPLLGVIELFKLLGETLRAAYVQTLAAKAMINSGRSVEGGALIAEALAAARSLGSSNLAALISTAAAQRSFDLGELARGRAHFAEALTIYEDMGAEWHVTALLGNLAESEFRFGNLDEAEALAGRALCLMRKVHSTTNDFCNLLNNLAAYRIERYRWTDAQAYAREALAIAVRNQLSHAIVWALQHLAAIAALSQSVAEGELAPMRYVARLFGYVDARITSQGFSRGYTEQRGYDRVRRVLCEASSGRELAILSAEGAALTQDEATALGLAIAIGP